MMAKKENKIIRKPNKGSERLQDKKWTVEDG